MCLIFLFFFFFSRHHSSISFCLLARLLFDSRDHLFLYLSFLLYYYESPHLQLVSLSLFFLPQLKFTLPAATRGTQREQFTESICSVPSFVQGYLTCFHLFTCTCVGHFSIIASFSFFFFFIFFFHDFYSICIHCT